MPDKIPDLLSSVVSDGFSLDHMAGGAVAGFFLNAALSALMRQRAERARQILLEELRSGEISLPHDQIEEGVAITYRYLQAAQQGAARLNLRLLAQVIAGRAVKSALYADEFLHYADMISSLRREEVFLLAELHRAWNSGDVKEAEEGEQCAFAFSTVAARLIPQIFSTWNEMQATAGALVRTGLLQVMPAIGMSTYAPTALLDKLVSLASLDDAISKESRS